jgi:phosphomannomutase
VTDLSSIVKAYDVRGLVGSQINEPVARALGAGFVQTLQASGEDATRIVIGYDMRESSPRLAGAFADGAAAAGAAVVMAGLGSTDQLYFASGSLNLPGAMFTASHNPATYNGIKMCRAGAKPIGLDSGLADIRDRAQAVLDHKVDLPTVTAQVERRDLLADYAAYLRKLVDLSDMRRLKVVVDAGNGMAGFTVPAVLGDSLLPALPLDIVAMYFELDGSFPNHEANPLEPANIVDLQKAVVERGADIGLAFDGDADRCFVVDEHGDPVSPSAITALVALRELRRYPGGTIIHNLITSSAVAELVAENGGKPLRTRVGHSFIKAEMARTGAVFGGEHSAHYYFKDFWGADTGMLAAMHVLAELGHRDEPLSRLGARFERYVASGEINSTVSDQKARLAAVEAAYTGRPGVVDVDHLDGLTVRFDHGGWLNVRPSNTEPLLRLNVEAPDRDTMVALRDGALAIIRG